MSRMNVESLPVKHVGKVADHGNFQGRIRVDHNPVVGLHDDVSPADVGRTDARAGASAEIDDKIRGIVSRRLFAPHVNQSVLAEMLQHSQLIRRESDGGIMLDRKRRRENFLFPTNPVYPTKVNLLFRFARNWVGRWRKCTQSGPSPTSEWYGGKPGRSATLGWECPSTGTGNHFAWSRFPSNRT